MSVFKLQENIDKYLKYMEFVKSASPHTLRHYRLDLSQAFYDKNSQNIRTTLLENELVPQARLAFSGVWKKMSLASRNRKAATLKSFFGWAYQEKLVSQDLALHIHSPRVPKKIPHFISVDEALSILAILKEDTPEDLRKKTLFLLLYGGGLRISEACQLKWSQVKAEQRSLLIKGKGNKERVVILPQLCMQVVQKMKTDAYNEFVFGETALHTRRAYEIIRQLGKQADLLTPLHPHALRHSFATHLLASGANLRTLQELLGHSSLQATEKYTHLSLDQLARTMEKLHPLGKGKRSSSE